MRALLVILLLVLAPVAAQAQERTGDAERRAARAARRDSLEQAIVQRFIERLSRDLQLDAEQRARTERVLKESGERRRALMKTSGELRGRMYRASRNSATTDAEFTRLLAEFDALRLREHDLWRQDQEELARVLNPRQRTLFLMAWALFQDNIRGIISERMREPEQKPLHP